MNDKKNNPCYQCDHRFPACHDTCKERAVWLAGQEIEKAEMRKEQESYLYHPPAKYNPKNKRYEPDGYR